MSPEPSPVAGPSRRRRRRSLRESLLSIVLGLEAFVMFFATLTINGLTELDTALVLISGGAFILLLVVVAALQRYFWAVVLGGVLQAAIIATGVLTPFMYVIGAGFAALWVWCWFRARRIDQHQPVSAVVPEGESP